jgi:cell division protein ZipA
MSQAIEEPRTTQNNNTDPEYNEVLIINVMSRTDREFAGVDVLQALLSCGMRFGDMNIFHRHVDDRGTGPVLFSIANAVNPGTFDLNKINDFSTRGLCFFLTLPNVINNMQAFNKMLDVAQKIRSMLDGEMKDDNRSVMTAQTVEHYRQRIRDFELLQLRQPHKQGK